MAISSKEDYLTRLNTIFGDEPTDDQLALMEDFSDTFDSLNDGENWKQKYEDNDKEWRKKYKERFLSGSPVPDPEPEPDPEPIGKMKFDDLFTLK